MTCEAQSFAIEELLENADWLRKLAEQLTTLDAAEDVVQDTWAAALHAPPARGRPAQPWLAEVVRNFARKALRTERRRRATHERAALIGTATTPGPETLLERAQAQHLLVAHVVKLAEPFRSTVLLRYFEGLSAAEIARTQNIPAGTVRWRLKEGLDRLRAALAAEYDKDNKGGKAWVALLAPLSGRPKAQLRPRRSVGAKPVLPHASLVGVAALSVPLVGAWLMRPRSDPPSLTASPPQRRPLPMFIAPVTSRPTVVVGDASPGGTIEGVIVAQPGGRQIAGAAVVFAGGGTTTTVRSGADGVFIFSPPMPGSYRAISVSAPGFRTVSSALGDPPTTFELHPEERFTGVRLALREQRSCAGRVVDAAGAPVSGAEISIHSRAQGGASARLTTDGVGHFEFPALEGGFVEARSGDRLAREQLGYGLDSDSSDKSCTLNLRLAQVEPSGPADVIVGKVVSATGLPLAGVELFAWTNYQLSPPPRFAFARALTDDSGRFELGPVDPTKYQIEAVQEGLGLTSLADVSAGRRDVVLRVAETAQLRGRAFAAISQQPVVAFTLVLTRIEDAATGAAPRAFSRYDSRGRFEIPNLPAGRYRATVFGAGFAPSGEQVVQVSPTRGADVAFRLSLGGRLWGRVVDRANGHGLAGAQVQLEARPASGALLQWPNNATTDEDGRFTLEGVAPGLVSVLVSHPRYHAHVLGGIAVSEGQETGPLVAELGAMNNGEKPYLEMVGIGAALAPKGDVLAVGFVVPSGGAGVAGLQPGDEVVAIDGTPARELGFEASIQKLRGAEGSEVVLLVRRGGETHDLRVTRRLVKTPTGR
jgi:RNA polymerase sigma-70 factor (ECF subfamily)